MPNDIKSSKIPPYGRKKKLNHETKTSNFYANASQPPISETKPDESDDRGSKQTCPPGQKEKQDHETKKSNSHVNASQDPNSETKSDKPDDNSPSINNTVNIPPTWSDNTVVHVAVAEPVPFNITLKSRPRSIVNHEDEIEERP